MATGLIFEPNKGKQKVKVNIIKDGDMDNPVFSGITTAYIGDGMSIDFNVEIVLGDKATYGLATTYEIYVDPATRRSNVQKQGKKGR